jgi:hypothetical protein
MRYIKTHGSQKTKTFNDIVCKDICVNLSGFHHVTKHWRWTDIRLKIIRLYTTKVVGGGT